MTTQINNNVNNNEDNNNIREICYHLKKSNDINIKDIDKITNKLVHITYHDKKFNTIYYKKETVSKCLNNLFIKEKYSHHKNEHNTQILNHNQQHLDHLIKIENKKLEEIRNKNDKRSCWKSFTHWLDNIFTKIC